MALPWLIGAAALAVGKAVYDSVKEDEEREAEERAERRAREREIERARERQLQAERERENERKRRIKEEIEILKIDIVDKFKDDYNFVIEFIEEKKFKISNYGKVRVLKNELDDKKAELENISNAILYFEGLKK